MIAFPIYVPSKGRVGRATTCTSLDRDVLPYFIITTPQEAESYRATYKGTVLPLQQEGDPISKTRNAILTHGHSQDWLWMIDDDITGLYHYNKGKRQEVSWTCLQEVERMIRALAKQYPDLVLVGFSIAPTQGRRPYILDGQCYMFIALSPQRLGAIRYNEHLSFYEDTDLLLHLLSEGKHTARLRHYAITYAPVGNNPGGLYTQYRQYEKRIDALKLQQWYGEDIIKIVPPPLTPEKPPYTIHLRPLLKAAKNMRRSHAS